MKKIILKCKELGIKYFVFYIFYRIFAQILFIYLSISKPKYGLNQITNREKKIIVSLTSYPARFHTLHICIKSLLWQSIKPDKIILYLGEDSAINQLSKKILYLTQFGLEIEHRSDNLKPHKKYFYVMQEYPDDIVITVDDDTIYDRRLISSLLQSYEQYPNAVSAKCVRALVKDKDGNLASYMDFSLVNRIVTQPSMQFLAIGVGGVLYPPYCIMNDAFDVEKIKNLCLNADDIWLKFMEIKNNVPVVWVPSYGLHTKFITIPNTQDTALYKTNAGYTVDNDIYIQNLEELYSINLVDYCL
ncbi:MAG: hypothetical protein LBD23_02290 [Oscillospiraceae bacterium]|nr:hypothetical protein [Oscillospiraceae bacterium]